jgi:dCTP deaminase
MTVLGENEIESSVKNGDLKISRGLKELAIEPASMDVHLGRKIKYPAKRDDEPVRVDDKETYPEYSTVDTPRPLVRENTFALATTEENINVPNNMAALLHGRSSVGRLGLFIENAGFVDPGFNGNLTLELYNPTNYDIELKAGMRIGQLTFHRVENAPDVGYSEHNGNKYDGQVGPTTSRLFEDFE